MLEIFFEDELIRCSDNPDVVKALLSEVTVIEAAGGVVRNEKGEVLWIYRRGRWDLPKGKVEKEELESEALREVREETGLIDVAIGDLAGVTLHLYPEPEKHAKKGEKAVMILKVTWWFEMMADSAQPVKPQLEEEIAEVRWVRVEEMQPMVEDTYGNIRKMLEEIFVP